jgi:hypothetical protein
VRRRSGSAQLLARRECAIVSLVEGAPREPWSGVARATAAAASRARPVEAVQPNLERCLGVDRCAKRACQHLSRLMGPVSTQEVTEDPCTVI